MNMHLLSGGRLRMRKSIFVPDADKNETIELSVPCALIRHAGGNVLFDTGCHPTVAKDAEERWGALARLMTPIMPTAENVVNGLSALGLSCDDIDLVVCSHLHPDHCGCNTFFKRATFIIHRNEVEAARAPDAQAQGYLAAEWEQEAPIDMIDGERDVFGDGRMVLLPLPIRHLLSGVRHRVSAHDTRYRRGAEEHLERRCAVEVARRDPAHRGVRCADSVRP